MRRSLSLLLVLAAITLGSAAPGAEPTENLRRTNAVRVFEAARQSVVNINTTQIIRQRFGVRPNDPFFDDPIFRHFFGRRFERDVERRSLGSGFVIHREGYIITNAHVVRNADAIEVILADGRQLEAEVLSSDDQHDLAVVKVDPPDDTGLTPVDLGDSSDLMPGEPAYAIGNPLGYQHSVTAGLISATNRPLRIGDATEFDNLVQTDTAINPGNSGGPLLNAYGQVIGINTVVRGDAQNIGFAVPINTLRDLLAELLSPLAINRVELGGHLAEKRSISPPANVTASVYWITRDSARPLGIKSINGQPISNIAQAAVALLGVAAGDAVTMRLAARLPDGRDAVRLMAREPKITNAQRLASSVLGLTPRRLTPADRARLRLGKARGLLVESVERGGPADEAGIEPGDLIVQMGRYRVDSLERLAVLLRDVRAGEPADLTVLRNGQLGMARLKLRSSRQADDL